MLPDVLQSVSLSVSGIRFPDRQIDSGASNMSYSQFVPVYSLGANRTCALFALRRGVERDVDGEFD